MTASNGSTTEKSFQLMDHFLNPTVTSYVTWAGIRNVHMPISSVYISTKTFNRNGGKL
jgi:hypothetical protein